MYVCDCQGWRYFLLLSSIRWWPLGSLLLLRLLPDSSLLCWMSWGRKGGCSSQRKAGMTQRFWSTVVSGCQPARLCCKQCAEPSPPLQVSAHLGFAVSSTIFDCCPAAEHPQFVASSNISAEHHQRWLLVSTKTQPWMWSSCNYSPKTKLLKVQKYLSDIVCSALIRWYSSLWGFCDPGPDSAWKCSHIISNWMSMTVVVFCCSFLLNVFQVFICFGPCLKNSNSAPLMLFSLCITFNLPFKLWLVDKTKKKL